MRTLVTSRISAIARPASVAVNYDRKDSATRAANPDFLFPTIRPLPDSERIFYPKRAISRYFVRKKNQNLFNALSVIWVMVTKVMNLKNKNYAFKSKYCAIKPSIWKWLFFKISISREEKKIRKEILIHDGALDESFDTWKGDVLQDVTLYTWIAVGTR